MNPQIMIIASGKKLDAQQVESALGTVPELTLQPATVERGIKTGVAKVIKWVAEFVGESSKVADRLIEQVTKQLAGATIEIQVDGRVIKIGNINRSQIIEALDHAAEVARKQNDL